MVKEILTGFLNDTDWTKSDKTRFAAMSKYLLMERETQCVFFFFSSLVTNATTYF